MKYPYPTLFNREKVFWLKIRSRLFFPMLVLLLIFSSTNFLQATALRFCVDCPVGAPNLPVTPGHAFVQFIPMNNAQAGNPNLVYGFYPAGRNVFGGPGVIRNDSKRNWDFCITYNVTPAQYNAAAAIVNAAIAAPPNYHLLNFNCVDFICGVAAAAGIVLPAAANRIGVKDPNVLWTSLSNIGAGGTFGGGSVGENISNVAPNGGPLEANSPHDTSYESAENLGHTDPDSLGDSQGLTKDFAFLGNFNLNINDTLTVFLTGGDTANALISMNWGDGSTYDAQAYTFKHKYQTMGQYNLDFLMFDGGVVQNVTMSYNVQANPASQNFQEILASQFPPSALANDIFGDSTIGLDMETPNAIGDPILASLDLYPVPAKDRLRISLAGINRVQSSITDLQGKVLKKVTLRSGSQEIDVSGLPNGVFLIYLDGIGAKRFVVNK